MSVTVHADVDGALRAGDSRRRTADELDGRLRQQSVGDPAIVEKNTEVAASSHGRLHVTAWFEDGCDAQTACEELSRRLSVALSGWREDAAVRVWAS